MANVKFEFSDMNHPTADDPTGNEVFSSAPGFFKATLHWERGHTPDWIECYFHDATGREFPWTRVRATDENGPLGIWRFDFVEEQFESGSHQWRATGRSALYGVVDNSMRSPRIKAEEDPSNDDDPDYIEWPVLQTADLISLEDLEAQFSATYIGVTASQLVIEAQGCGTEEDPCTLADFQASGINRRWCAFNRNSDRDSFLETNFAESRFNQEPNKLGPNYALKGVRRGWVFKDIMRHSAGSVSVASRPILAVYNRSAAEQGQGFITGEGDVIRSNFQQSQVAGIGANALAYDVANSWPWIGSSTGDSGYDYRTVWTGKTDTYAASGQAIEIKQRGQFEWDDSQCFGLGDTFVSPSLVATLVDVTAREHYYFAGGSVLGLVDCPPPAVFGSDCDNTSIGEAHFHNTALTTSDSSITAIPTFAELTALFGTPAAKWAQSGIGGTGDPPECAEVTGSISGGIGDISDGPNQCSFCVLFCGPDWGIKELSIQANVRLGADAGQGFKLITVTECVTANHPETVPDTNGHPFLKRVAYFVAVDTSLPGGQPLLPDNTVPCDPTTTDIVDIFVDYFANPSQLSSDVTTTPSGADDNCLPAVGFEVKVDGRNIYSHARAFGMGMNNPGAQFTATLPGSETTWNPALNQFKVRRELIVNDYGINEGPELLKLAGAYMTLPGKEFGGFTTLKLTYFGILRASSAAPTPNKIIQAGDRLNITAGIPKVEAGPWVVDDIQYEFPKGVLTILLSQRPAAQARHMASSNIRHIGESLAGAGGVFESKWFRITDTEFLNDPDSADPTVFFDTFQFEHFLGTIPRTITMVAAKQKIFDWYDRDVLTAAQPLYVPRQFFDLSQVQGVGYNVLAEDGLRIIFHFWRYLFYDDLDGEWILPEQRFLKVWVMT